MTEKQAFSTPITNSWGAVTFVNHGFALVDSDHPNTCILLDKDNIPIRLEDAEKNPLGTKGFIVVVRRTGDPRPTEDEIKMAESWKKAVIGTDIKIVDFIIICGGSHYSFATEKVEGPGPKGF